MPRLIVLRALILVFVTVLIGRLYQLQVIESSTRRFGSDVEVTTRRYLTVPPRRGEIFAADGATLLAESVPTYHLAVVPGRLPDADLAPEQRALVLARLSQVAGLTSTLTIEPPEVVYTNAALRLDLADLTPVPIAPTATQPMTLTIAAEDTLQALTVSRTYSDVVQLANPIEELLLTEQVRGFQSILIAEDISPDLALALRENSNYLPGVTVVEGFRRLYPQSRQIPSLSHLLGYIGRITECELVVRNPASSWFTAMVDVVAHSGRCGLVASPIDPASLGLPPYQGDDLIGKDGLERYYENDLRGIAGIETLLVDALGRPVSAPSTLRPVVNGANLVLTIDVAFQREVEQILQRWIDEGERRRLEATEEYKRDYEPIVSGVAVALDPRDGRVLAMASLPSYDNNIWIDVDRVDELQAFLAPETPEAQATLQRLAPFTNRAISGQYPVGSTLKQFVGAVALQQGVIEADTELRDPGLLQLIERSGALFELPNSVRNRDNGEINVIDAMRLSSNVFFASLAGGNDEAINLDQEDTRIDGLGVDRLVEGLSWFNFGRPLEIDIAGEAPGLLPTKTWKAQTLRETWTTGDRCERRRNSLFASSHWFHLSAIQSSKTLQGNDKCFIGALGLYQPHF
jgi:penicillin-binding protein 2